MYQSPPRATGVCRAGGLCQQQTSTHLSKYWSDGGSSSLPEMVKWHACLQGGAGRWGGAQRLALATELSPPWNSTPLPKALEPRKGYVVSTTLGPAAL